MNTSKEEVRKISLDLIDEPRAMARMSIDPEVVAELAKSIKEIGLLQPIILRKDGERFEIVAGHRRFLAHKLLGEKEIAAFVKEMSVKDMIIARATENLNRVDLTPVEEAQIYSELMNDQGMSVEEVGKVMGKAPATILRRMQILKMPESLQKALHEGKISMSVAEELWSIDDPTSLDYYLRFAIENGCSRDVARSWAKDYKDMKRREREEGEKGVLARSPYESRPVYISCDICDGPMRLGDEIVLRVCPDCADKLKSVLR